MFQLKMSAVLKLYVYIEKWNGYLCRKSKVVIHMGVPAEKEKKCVWSNSRSRVII